MVFDSILKIFVINHTYRRKPFYCNVQINHCLIKYETSNEYIWILSFATHIYLFTPLSWCHDFGKLKYFTNRSSRLLLFCGIQKTAKSSQLLQLDFSSLRSNFTFYFTFDLLIFLDEWLLDKYMLIGHLKIQ